MEGTSHTEQFTAALEKNSLSAVKEIVPKHLQPNRTTSSGQTLLHLAVQKGCLGISRFLIEQGASVTQLTPKGQSIIDIAVSTGRKDLLLLLLSNGAEPTANTEDEQIQEIQEYSNLIKTLSQRNTQTLKKMYNIMDPDGSGVDELKCYKLNKILEEEVPDEELRADAREFVQRSMIFNNPKISYEEILVAFAKLQKADGSMSVENFCKEVEAKIEKLIMSSYSETLLSNFEEVHKNSEDKRKSCEDFLHLLKERAQHEEHYARGLERIAQHNIPAVGTIAQAACAFKNDLLNQAMQHKLLSENISKDLIIPLKELITKQNQSVKKILTEGRKLIKDEHSAQDTFIKARNKYWKLAKDEDDLLDQFEHGQFIAQKLGFVRKEISVALKNYSLSIKNVNFHTQRKQNTMSKILEIYQQQEEARIELMKDTLRKLVIYQASCTRNLQYDVENLSKACENIDASLDIATFIAQTSTGQKSDARIEFEPYAPQNLPQTAMDQLKTWVEGVLQLNTDEWSKILKTVIQRA